MEWKEEHDLLLCREILVCQPYKFKERTVERGKIWEEISNHLNTCETAKFRVNKRSVRDWRGTHFRARTSPRRDLLFRRIFPG